LNYMGCHVTINKESPIRCCRESIGFAAFFICMQQFDKQDTLFV
jgi:hypothetical protein